MPVKKSLVDIAIEPEKCSGCLMCALRCSLKYYGTFNPLKSRIKRINGNEISFTEECTKCGLCVQYCIYGALILKEGK